MSQILTEVLASYRVILCRPDPEKKPTQKRRMDYDERSARDSSGVFENHLFTLPPQFVTSPPSNQVYGKNSVVSSGVRDSEHSLVDVPPRKQNPVFSKPVTTRVAAGLAEHFAAEVPIMTLSSLESAGVSLSIPRITTTNEPRGVATISRLRLLFGKKSTTT